MFENSRQDGGFNPFFSGMRQPQRQPMQNDPWPNFYGPGSYPQDQRGSGGMWIPVNSLDEAKNAFVQPGQEKWFMVTNKMMFAVKSVSSAGVVDFQAFDFNPHIEPQASQVQVPQENSQIDLMNNIAEKLQNVLDKVNGLEETVENLKGEKENGKSVKQVSNAAAKSGAGSK